MFSPQGFTKRPVPALPAVNNSASFFGNSYPSTFPSGFINNCPFTFGANTASNSMKLDMSVPPPGFSSNSANLLPSPGTGGSYTPNGFVNPLPFGSPQFPACPVPFPSTTANQNAAFSSFQTANFVFPPASFSVPPPSISRPPRNTNSKFHNSRHHHQYSKPSMLFHCESCDRDFLTEAKQRQHISEHVVCGVDGCSFSAHTKIVEKHISFQHRTGLFNRIVKGNSPEEIDKWIAERKRQFPTQEKIEQKQAQQEEMNQRGERYSEPKKRFNNRYSNDNRKHNNWSNRFDNSRRFSSNKRTHKNNTPNTPETDFQDQSAVNIENRPKRRREVIMKADEDDDDHYIRNLAPFRGTAYYLNAVDEVDETDSAGKDDSTICSDSVANETPTFDVYDSDTESNDAIYSATSPAGSQISLNEVPNSSASPVHRDADNFESNARSPAQSKDETSLRKSSHLDEEVSSNSIDFFGMNQDCEANDFSDSHEDVEEKPAEEKPADVSRGSGSQDCSFVASPSMSAMSTSLDLLKAYDFSDDDEEGSKEIVETTASPEMAAPTNEPSDDSAPEECSSKICPPVEIVSVEEKVTSKPVSIAGEVDSKRSRKRKRHKDGDSKKERNPQEADRRKMHEDGEAKNERNPQEADQRKRQKVGDSKNERNPPEADKEKPNVPDAWHQQKRNRRPTLLEKLLANEIKHERNVILQCVRYVVQNNYFDVGQSK